MGLRIVSDRIDLFADRTRRIGTIDPPWRRTGNLAAPGIAHAVIDALRNAVAVL